MKVICQYEVMRINSKDIIFLKKIFKKLEKKFINAIL